MRRLKNFLDFYVNSSMHVAMAVVALTWVTYTEFNIELNWSILAFNLFATITGYNFVKYFGLAKFHHRSLAGWLKVIQVFSAFSFVGLAYFTLRLKLDVILFYTAFGIVTFLYAIPLLPRRFLFDSEKNLRSISGLKVYVIASVWVAATVIVPMIDAEVRIRGDVILKAVQIFLVVLVWMLPFEIRDLKYDSIRLSTIPQMIGIKRTKLFGTLLIGIVFILELVKRNVGLSSFQATALVCFITLFLLLKATKRQGEYFSGLWVEAIPIYWLIILLVL